jgi:hypothetical protein
VTIIGKHFLLGERAHITYEQKYILCVSLQGFNSEEKNLSVSYRELINYTLCLIRTVIELISIELLEQ